MLPTIYDKDLISEKIKNQIANRYNIEIKFNEKINYSLLPKPSFASKNISIIQDKKIKNVIFTGSLDTAKIIQSNLQKKDNIPTFIAETGGLNCMIVDSSALPEHVVKDVVSSGFDSAGQRCSACRILCVEENIYEKIKDILIGAMKTQNMGDPEKLSTDIGPVIDADAQANINDHIKKFTKFF